jgi:DNA-binding NarL/FixJ family response regulator
MCTALVVSDIRLYRQGLTEMLGRDGRLEVCGNAAIGAEALELAGRMHPNVVLMDMAVPDGLETIRRMPAVSPEAKVIALGISENRNDVLACAEAGAAGYVCRQSSLDDLVTAVEGALCGELACSPQIAGALFLRVGALGRGSGGPPDPAALTPREAELCQVLAEGLTNQEIAGRLGIQLSTVKAHVHNVLEKLGAHSRGEAVAKLRRTGDLLPPRAANPRPGHGGNPLASRSEPRNGQRL